MVTINCFYYSYITVIVQLYYSYIKVILHVTLQLYYMLYCSYIAVTLHILLNILQVSVCPALTWPALLSSQLTFNDSVTLLFLWQFLGHLLALQSGR